MWKKILAFRSDLWQRKSQRKIWQKMTFLQLLRVSASVECQFLFILLTRKSVKETEFKNEFEHAEQLNVPFHPAIPLSLDCATSSWEGIVLGGTFDHLHSGHHLMLSIAAQGARQRVRVGVTDLSMLKTKKFIGQLQSLAQRVNNVRDFLSSVCAPSVELDIFPIADPYGPTLDATNVQAIVVSDETVEFTRIDINKKRSEKGIPILEIVCVPLLDPPTLVIHGAKGKLSSTQLRNLQVERTLIRLLNV